MFLHIWICLVKGFSKKYNLLQFAQSFLHILCFITRFRNWYLDFSNFFIFYEDHWSKAQGFSKNVSNFIDLYHNKKIERDKFNPPPRQPVSKTDVRLNRVNTCNMSPSFENISLLSKLLLLSSLCSSFLLKIYKYISISKYQSIWHQLYQ